jgi:hypothetical protein
MYQSIRSLIPVFIEDMPKYKNIEVIGEFLKSHEIKM